MKILAIETSCDETALALIDAKGGIKNPSFSVKKHFIASQVDMHRPFGGVVPNLAKREHLKNLPILYKKLGKQNIDAIAVTVGPGLEPALWTGIEFSKELSQKLKKPLLGVNHMEGHLFSFLLPQKTEISKSEFQISKQNWSIFPLVALVVSGGHTILLLMQSLTKWKKLGETRDDAAGEAFDKVARMLGLSYPGGPEIQKLSEKGNDKAIDFPRPMLKALSGAKGDRAKYEFSFSGLKTSVLYYLRDHKRAKKADVAASFQRAVIDVLVAKTMRAAKEYRAISVLLCGGVAASKPLRNMLCNEAEEANLHFYVPPFEFNTDNAAMIGAAAYINHLRKKKYPIKADANLNL